MVKAVYDTVVAKAPDVPEAGRWVYAAEVLNALNRRNVGVGPSGAILLFPRVPSAGLLVEF